MPPSPPARRGPAPARAAAWKGLTASRLEAAHLAALMDGSLPYLQVPGFFEPAWCRELVRRFMAQKEPAVRSMDVCGSKWLYRHSGLIFYQMERELEAYFAGAAEAASHVRALYAGGADPLERLDAAFAAATGWRRVEALEAGRPYSPDIVVALPPGTSIPLHHDTLTRDRGLFVQGFPKLLSWNLYYSVPEKGGEFVIHRKSWGPEDEPRFIVQTRSYDPALVRGLETARCRPQVGGLIVFPADHYHQVSRIEGSRYRVQGHSLLSADPSRGTYSFWI